MLIVRLLMMSSVDSVIMVIEKQKHLNLFIILWAVALELSVVTLHHSTNTDLLFQVQWSWSYRVPK